MPNVVGVVFKEAGKVYDFDRQELGIEVADQVIVETAQGLMLGQVVELSKRPDGESGKGLKRVLRKATEKDLDLAEKARKREKEALEVCDEKIKKHKLPMKLVDAECVFDGSRIVFYFSAESRVDFRDLVKDLASTLRARIELRQIGVRDQAKMVGGLGSCGRRLCCTIFMSDFEPVSIKMAKVQDLPLNPIKISGMCSRLMCCLKYEYEAYSEFKKRAPKRGKEVETPSGPGRVIDYNVPRELILVETAEGRRVEFALADLSPKAREAG